MKSKVINPNAISVAAFIAAIFFGCSTTNSFAQAEQTSPAASIAKKPNILVIFGDDIGQTNVSAYSMGMMGYRTPNIALARAGSTTSMSASASKATVSTSPRA